MAAHMTPPSPRCELEARIVAHTQTRDDAFVLTLAAPPIAQAARPGQFLEILFGENYAPLLRRPFSIFQADPEAGAVSILYRQHGAFTSGLRHLRPDDAISVLGPLGRPFQWETRDRSQGTEAGEESRISPPAARRPAFVLIAGGIGAPPLCFLAAEMARAFRIEQRDTRQIVVINAARTGDHLIGMAALEALNVTVQPVTEDGSQGQQGRVTDALLAHLAVEAEGDTRLFACGPMPMLRAIGDIALARGLPCQLAVETAMPCGIGLCWGCALPMRAPAAPNGFRYARACWEGPVFEASELFWTPVR